MKKITVFTMIACMLLSGCGAGVPAPGKNAGILNVHTSYFDDYSMDKDENTCKVRGTVHQAADDRNGVITCVTAEGGNGSIAVTGSMECTEGNIRLLYMAPDGTETLIAEGIDGKIDAQVDVAEGEGNICFASDGKSAVCRFDIKMEAGECVRFSGSMEETEGMEETESMEDVEDIGDTGDIEEIAIEAVEDNWPESILYNSDGIYADPLSVTFEINQPTTLSLDCKTRDGKLRMEIAGAEGSDKETYFDETDPEGIYTVAIDKAGKYQILFYARYHVGSVEITPLAE